MNKNLKIFLAGHQGMVGSAILKLLKQKGDKDLILRTRDELDLIRQTKVEDFFQKENPDVVIMAAAKVGGIMANNTYRGQFIYENLMIQSNIIHTAYLSRVRKLLFLGSACIYPRHAPQPMKEEYLLTDRLEATNEPYAMAKIAGIKLCENYYRQYGCDFISVMPTNLYGPHDNFDLETSHVIPALIRKFHEAKLKNQDFVSVWGTGKPRREFLHVDDLAEACVFLMEKLSAQDLYNRSISCINIGTGEDLTISDLAEKIARIVGFDGRLEYDKSKPDGVPRKLLDVVRIHELGWQAKIPLREGLLETFQWYLKNLTKE